jgi:Zn finger protein HypA/HybF involved in hydrogenase expression
MSRVFRVKFRCSDCEVEYEHNVVDYFIPKQATDSELKNRFRMYTPSYCVECGSDDFEVISFERLEK